MRKCVIGLFVGVLLLMAPVIASAVIVLQDGDIKLDGFMRTWTQVYTGKNTGFANFRGTVQLEGSFRFAENTTLFTIFRGTKESLGNWADRYNVPQDYFDEDFSDCVRELFLEVVYPGLTIRAGRQQVIWGETDFFRSADVINPIDFSWRTFLEDWQDIRIPNWMLNVVGNVPECWLGGIGGQVQLIWKPGLDDADDVVDKFAPTGAPWAIRSSPPVPFNVSMGADYPGKGLRNGSIAGRYANQFSALNRIMNWSINYSYGWQEGPVASFLGFDVPTNTANLLLEYQRANVAGFTFNTSIDELESVLRAEVSYWINRAYNFDTAKADLGTILGDPKGWVRKDMLRYAIGWDWTPSQWWTKWGSRQAWMYSLQLFQDVIMDYDEDEFILRTGGYPPRHHQQETVITFFCNGHYWSDRIQPGFAYGWDVRGGQMFIPSCTFTPGDHWRAKLEWDVFDSGNGGRASYDNIGYLSSNDIICFKLTYQF